MNKTLFEKLTQTTELISLKQSVIDNIGRILGCGGFLDSGIDDFSVASMEGNLNKGLGAVVDQAQDDEQQLAKYRKTIERTLLKFEPRLKGVKVTHLTHQGIQSCCQIKMVLVDGEFEQEFMFG